ncbi:MAG: DASS family sodium-coupled anion symporter [Crocinitomicaceae bacterium]|nr:DASS family sodium-coupled anion symporter [Crocinitomicaceae bacterium]
MKTPLALLSGPILFILLWSINPFGLEPAAAIVSGIVVWMLLWWVTETVPMAVTSLLPILLFPLFGVMKLEDVCQPYGDKFVFLFLGGFIIALAMEKWNVHRRIALKIIHMTGTRPNRIVFGFMLASFLISMWISNTATALMMFPIAMSVITLLMGKADHSHDRGRKNFSTSILLSIAYGASIGGIGTLVGSPPNAAMAGVLETNHQVTITFFDWMVYGFPFALVLMLLTYFSMVKIIFPNRLGNFEFGGEVIAEELRSLGKMKKEEKIILVVFLLTALLWVFQDTISKMFPAIHLSDAGIAIAAGISLFILPSGEKEKTVLAWKDTEKLPWGVLLMFGGGLSLAKGFKESGLVSSIAEAIKQMEGNGDFVFVIVLCMIGLFLTSLMSNLAMVNIFVPVVGALAVASGKSPEIFAIPVTIAASCDFMFPMSTPPNAIAYSSGYVKARDMFKAGLVLNVIAIALLTLMIYMVL